MEERGVCNPTQFARAGPASQPYGEHDDHQKFSHRGIGRRGDVVFHGRAAAPTRQDAIAAKNAAKSGDGARLGASLAVLQRAAARRIPQSDVTRAVTRKVAGAARQRRLRFHQRVRR